MTVVGFARLAWLTRDARPLADRRWLDLAAQISAQAGVCRRIRLLQIAHPSLLESDRACDDEVLRSAVDPLDYARHLLQLARAAERRAWLPAPAMARPSSLQKRVTDMLDDHVDRRPVPAAARAATALALLVLTTIVAAAQTFTKR